MTIVKADEIDAEVYRVMGWLEDANPISDAKKALNNGDHGPWGIRGIIVYLPSIDKSDYKEAAKKYGYRVIEGTSDGLRSDEHKKFNDLAKQYANKYNIYAQTSSKN